MLNINNYYLQVITYYGGDKKRILKNTQRLRESIQGRKKKKKGR